MLKHRNFAYMSRQLGAETRDLDLADGVIAEAEAAGNIQSVECLPGLYRAKSRFYPQYRVLFIRQGSERVALAIVPRDDGTYDTRTISILKPLVLERR